MTDQRQEHPSHMHCFSCRFWHCLATKVALEMVEDDRSLQMSMRDYGECRRYPPSMVSQLDMRQRLRAAKVYEGPHSERQVEIFASLGPHAPITNLLGWCGEWQGWPQE